MEVGGVEECVTGFHEVEVGEEYVLGEVQADLPPVHVLDGGGVAGERAGGEKAKRRGAEVAERIAEFPGFEGLWLKFSIC